MKKIFTEYYSRFQELILYGIIGCISSGLDFLVYSLLVEICALHYLIANMISVTIGITTSFVLNRQYNFKVKDHVFRRFITFFSIGLFGLGLSSLILYFSISVMEWSPIVSKILSIVFVVFIQFLLNKFITFKQS